MRRTHCIPGATLLFIAFLLSLLVCPWLRHVRSITPNAYFFLVRETDGTFPPLRPGI